RFEKFGGGLGPDGALLPVLANLGGAFQILTPGPVRLGVALGGITLLMFEQCVGQRAHDRLGMAPADCLQGAPGIADVGGLVADVAAIAGAVAPEELDDLPRPGIADKRCHGPVAALLVPVVHGLNKAVAGLGAGGELAFVDRRHAPVAFLGVAGLR